jgi:anti-sigma B factor antagonist
MLEYQQSMHGDVTVLTVSGNLDSLTVPEIRPVIEKLVATGVRKVALELSRLEVIDSSGIGAIVSLFKRVRGMGGDVKIAGVQGQPREILRLLGLERAFDIVPTVEDAARRFS